MLVRAGAWKGGGSRYWSRKAKLECWKRGKNGRWEGPVALGGGGFDIVVYRGYPNFAVPRVSPPNFVPVVWNKKGETILRLTRIPVE